MSPNPEKLLIVDGHTPPAETEPYLDYYVKQNYGSSSVSFTSTGVTPAFSAPSSVVR